MWGLKLVMYYLMVETSLTLTTLDIVVSVNGRFQTTEMPRQSTFKKGQRGASQSPDDMKIASRPVMAGGGPSVAPNEIAGRPDPGFKQKRPLFNQRYWRASMQHPDNLQGNPDARREIISGD